MRKLLLVLSTVFILTGLAFAPVNENKSGVDANEDVRETVSLTFVVNEAAYRTFARQSAERGISGQDLGSWIINNVQGSVGLGNPPGVFVPENYEVVLMKVDVSGRITQEDGVMLRKSGGEKVEYLPRSVASMIGRYLSQDGLFAYDAFVPTDELFAYDAFIGTPDEAKRVFSRGAAMHMSRASGNMVNPVGIGLLILPSQDQWKPDMKVKPGAVLFIAGEKPDR